MDVCTLVMIFVMNGPSVAEYQLHATIATWNMFYGGSMEGCIYFGHDTCIELV